MILNLVNPDFIINVINRILRSIIDHASSKTKNVTIKILFTI
jgi:hypothetical protein